MPAGTTSEPRSDGSAGARSPRERFDVGAGRSVRPSAQTGAWLDQFSRSSSRALKTTPAIVTPGLFEHRLGPPRRVEGVVARADDQQRGIGERAEHPAIGQPEHGRAVDDHPVVVPGKALQQLPHLQRAQDRRPGCRSGRPTAGNRGSARRCAPRPAAREARLEARRPARDRCSTSKTSPRLDRLRSASSEQRSLAGPGAGGRQVQRRGALALAALGAGDQQGDDRSALAAGRAEQARPEVAVRVRLRGVRRAGRPDVAAAVQPGDAVASGARRRTAAGSSRRSGAPGP